MSARVLCHMDASDTIIYVSQKAQTVPSQGKATPMGIPCVRPQSDMRCYRLDRCDLESGSWQIPSSSTKNPEGQGDDVIITGAGHSSPGHPVILAQHSAKEEQIARDKGKWSNDLSNYAHLNADELHSGFLNRLHSNRHYEAGLVNLMKERYEVNSSPLHIDL